MEHADSSIRTINRVCDILNTFEEGHPDLSLTEISRRIGLPKSTTHRLIEALKSQGLLVYEPGGQNYQLGYQLIRWGARAQSNLNIRRISLQILRDLTAKTGENSVLSLRSGNFGVWVEIVECDQPLRLAMRIGKPVQLHAGASSKVLLAFLPMHEVDRILSEIELTPILPNTITDRQKLLDEVKKSRELGYTTSFEETDAGVMGIAAPVFDHTGQVTAGIGIIAPTSRISPQKVPEIARYVVQAGKELSCILGSSTWK